MRVEGISQKMSISDIQKAVSKKFPRKRCFQEYENSGNYYKEISPTVASELFEDKRKEPFENIRDRYCKLLRTEKLYHDIPPLRPIDPDSIKEDYQKRNSNPIDFHTHHSQWAENYDIRNSKIVSLEEPRPPKEPIYSPCLELPCIKLSSHPHVSQPDEFQRLRSLSPEIYDSRQYCEDRPSILHNYLEKTRECRYKSDVLYNMHLKKSNRETPENVNPICLRTGSSIIHEIVGSNQSDIQLPISNLGNTKQNTPITQNSKFHNNQLQKKNSQPRYKNMFQSAHHELLEIGTPSTCGSPQEPPELIKIHSDDEDSRSDSDTSDDSSYTESQVIDTSLLSSGEILSLIKIPDLVSYSPDLESVSNYLEPHQIGHINHLIKCYADAYFTINLPSSVLNAESFNPVDYIDIHMCAVLRTYFILLKTEEYLNLEIQDQVSVLQNLLPSVIALGFPLYRTEAKSWTIPIVKGRDIPFSYGIYSLLQILPKICVSRMVEIHETSHRLNVDWTMSMLFILIFVFTPIKKSVNDLPKIHSIRNTYVKLLHKYLEWKVGPVNIVTVFPEILKLMDAIMRYSQEMQDIEFWLREEEIALVQLRLKNITPVTFCTGFIETDPLIKDESPMKFVSYSNIYNKMSAVFVKSVLVKESKKSSVKESTEPEIELSKLPLNLSRSSPMENVYMSQSTTCT